MSTPQVGEIVHFVLDGGPAAGEHRPAIVVRIHDAKAEQLDLLVMTDGAADGDIYHRGLTLVHQVAHDEDEPSKPHTWHGRDATDAWAPVNRGYVERGQEKPRVEAKAGRVTTRAT